jgi:hypothetical protein
MLRADNLRFFLMEDILESENIPLRSAQQFSDKAKAKDPGPL